MRQCYHHLANNGFLAGSTDAFSHRLDPESVEVGLQASQHVVQLVGRFGRPGGRSLALGLDLTEMEHHSGFTIPFILSDPWLVFALSLFVCT